MDKSNQETAMLVVDPPDELVLEGPFDRANSKKISVYNPSKTTRVTFKLKTTTPQLFFVRPNVGMIMPGETVKIEILVHPIGQDQIGNRHKFLMQAALADVNIKDLLGFWKTLSPNSIWDTKIRVKMIQAEGDELGRNPPVTLTEGQTMKEVNQDGEHNDSIVKLMQQVNEMEDEREKLKHKLGELEKEKEELTNLSMMQQKKKVRRGGVYILLILVSAIVAGIFYNANYM